MKKLLTFLLCIVLLMGAIGLTACDLGNLMQKPSDRDADKPVAELAVQGVSKPKLGATITRFNAGDNGEPRVTRRLTATVEPETALNKQVDYSVSWAEGAALASEDVTEYITVEQDFDGSADATVSCYKAFGNDTILITVVTREGGFRAYCEVVFSGLISELEIVSANGLTLTTDNGYVYIDSERVPIHGQTYYELGVNRTYDFDVNVNNIFNETTYDLSLVVGYSDTTFKVKRDGFPSSVTRNVPLSELQLDLFEITLNGTSLRIVVKDKILMNYTDPVYYEENHAFYLSTEDNWGNPDTKNQAAAQASYFTVTVTDSKSGLSDEFKFWIESTAGGLHLSETTIEF